MGSGHSQPDPVPWRELAAGDLVLSTRPLATPMGSLPTGVVQGIVAMQHRNAFSTKQQSLNPWSEVAVVVQHKQDRYLLQATTAGLTVQPLLPSLASMARQHIKVAVRRLDLAAEDSSKLHELLHLALEAAARKFRWDAFDAQSKAVHDSHRGMDSQSEQSDSFSGSFAQVFSKRSLGLTGKSSRMGRSGLGLGGGGYAASGSMRQGASMRKASSRMLSVLGQSSRGVEHDQGGRGGASGVFGGTANKTGMRAGSGRLRPAASLRHLGGVAKPSGSTTMISATAASAASGRWRKAKGLAMSGLLRSRAHVTAAGASSPSSAVARVDVEAADNASRRGVTFAGTAGDTAGASSPDVKDVDLGRATMTVGSGKGVRTQARLAVVSESAESVHEMTPAEIDEQARSVSSSRRGLGSAGRTISTRSRSQRSSSSRGSSRSKRALAAAEDAAAASAAAERRKQTDDMIASLGSAPEAVVDLFRTLLGRVTRRCDEAMQELSPAMISEARRAYGNAVRSGNDRVELRDIKSLVSDFKGRPATEEEVACFRAAAEAAADADADADAAVSGTMGLDGTASSMDTRGQSRPVRRPVAGATSASASGFSVTDAAGVGSGADRTDQDDTHDVDEDDDGRTGLLLGHVLAGLRGLPASSTATTTDVDLGSVAAAETVMTMLELSGIARRQPRTMHNSIGDLSPSGSIAVGVVKQDSDWDSTSGASGQSKTVAVVGVRGLHVPRRASAKVAPESLTIVGGGGGGSSTTTRTHRGRMSSAKVAPAPIDLTEDDGKVASVGGTVIDPVAAAMASPMAAAAGSRLRSDSDSSNNQDGSKRSGSAPRKPRGGGVSEASKRRAAEAGSRRCAMYVTAASFSAAGPKADGAAIELLRGRLGPERPVQLPRAAFTEADTGAHDAGDDSADAAADPLKPQSLLSKASNVPRATQKNDYSDGVWSDVASAFGFNGEGGDGWIVDTGEGEAYARSGGTDTKSDDEMKTKKQETDDDMAQIAATAETEDEFVARHMAQLRAKAASGAIMGRRPTALP